MSEIYNLVRKTCIKIESSIVSTFVFSSIINVFLFLENLWLDSFFKKMYPGSDFISFLKKSYILKNHIFSPLIVIIAFSIFMILASIPISPILQINIIIGFVFFFIFTVIVPKFILKGRINYIKFDSKEINVIGFVLFLIGFIFFLWTVIDIGGVPLLKPSLRYLLNPKITMPVFLIIPGIALISSHILDRMQKGFLSKASAKFRIISLSVICIFLLLILGYRTPIVAIVLIVVIMGYYTKLLEIWEILGGFFLTVLIIVGIGYFRSVEEYALGGLSALDFLNIRASFTMHVLDLLSNISGYTGFMHGKLSLSILPGPEIGPRRIIGKLIVWNSEINITPTLIGPMLVEFGSLGVAIGMSILGFILGVGYKILQKTKDSFYIMLYAIILGYTLISVETGLLDVNVVGYLIIAAIIYIYIIFKNQIFISGEK
ncbi:MAG: oligosaccharide repeat unit polymerase [Euryarchaeota archaeon]|nr:oligosaccharide repeat unit polymerase [Euryarchaeota archaeon]